MRVVVLSPHRGDAALGVGLAVAGWLAAGEVVEVLNAFTETLDAPFSDVGSIHANDRQSYATAIRRREDVTWNRLLGGRIRFHDLDMLDAPLRLNCAPEAVWAEEIRPGDRALARLTGALAKLARAAATAGTGSFGFVLPLACGGHVDHRIARQAGLEALAETGLPIAFYKDWPLATAEEPDEDVVAGLVALTGLALQQVSAPADPVEREALKSAAARKRKMVLAYDSLLDSDAVTAAGERAMRMDGRERLWANAAWVASPPRCVRA